VSEEITRDLRRTSYFLDAAMMALADVLREMGVDANGEQRRTALGALHMHLSSAWDDGARREADLRASVDTLRSHRMKLEAEIRTLKGRLGSSE
jgi:hypothetical protein